MITEDSMPMLPWVIVDPRTWDSFDHSGAHILCRSAAEFIRRHCSVVIGKEDLRLLHERATAQAGGGYEMLREVLRSCPVRVRGLGVSEVRGVIECLPVEQAPRGAVLGDVAADAESALTENEIEIMRGLSELLHGDFRYRVEDATSRTYPAGTDRELIWEQVLEPATRADVINLVESYIFNPFTWDRPEISSTGLYWFLTKLSDRASLTSSRCTVVIRGGHDDFEGSDRRAAERRMHDRCRSLVEEFSSTIDLHLEVFHKPNVIHDRFMLARSGAAASRLLTYGTPFISEAGKLVGISRRFSETPKKRVHEFSMIQTRENLAVREGEWNASSGRIRMRVSPGGK